MTTKKKVTKNKPASKAPEKTKAAEETTATEEKPVVKAKEVKKTPEAPVPDENADRKKALELMKVNNVESIYKVGKYWFTKAVYAEQFAKENKTSLETFNK